MLSILNAHVHVCAHSPVLLPPSLAHTHMCVQRRERLISCTISTSFFTNLSLNSVGGENYYHTLALALPVLEGI